MCTPFQYSLSYLPNSPITPLGQKTSSLFSSQSWLERGFSSAEWHGDGHHRLGSNDLAKEVFIRVNSTLLNFSSLLLCNACICFLLSKIPVMCNDARFRCDLLNVSLRSGDFLPYQSHFGPHLPTPATVLCKRVCVRYFSSTVLKFH